MPTCPHCHREIRFDQPPLNDHEKERLPFGNQYTQNLTNIEWRTVKGAAIYYGVSDWTSKVDTSLTMSENVNLMEQHGTNMDVAGGRTMKDAAAQEKAKMRGIR